jgi:hypothetical protein
MDPGGPKTCGSGSFYHQAKIVRKTLIPTVLGLLLDFLSLKNDVDVPSRRNKQNNFFFKLVFVGVLKVNDENSRVRSRIHESEAWIRGSGSTTKCHGSGTLFLSFSWKASVLPALLVKGWSVGPPAGACSRVQYSGSNRFFTCTEENPLVRRCNGTTAGLGYLEVE